jgi:16S rRNA (guanine527-N7)-methyltransferase
MAKRPPLRQQPVVEPASPNIINNFVTLYPVSRETLTRLQAYERVLLHWQKSMNLVAKSTLSEIWTRHFADSAQLLQIMKSRGVVPRVWLDLGSGAGLPGLVVAIMLAESATPAMPVRVILIESDARKCAFLREVLRQVGLSANATPSIPLTGSAVATPKVSQHRGGITVDILPTRIENLENHARVKDVSVISARAVAPLDVLLGLSAPYFGPETCAIFPKGRDYQTEIEMAQKSWDFELALTPSQTDSEAQILSLTGLQAKHRLG